MNIDYARIIERANVRKDILQSLENILKEAPAMTLHLNALIDWVSLLEEEHKSLDSEGRLLLPKRVNENLEYMSYARIRLLEIRSNCEKGISKFGVGEQA